MRTIFGTKRKSRPDYVDTRLGIVQRLQGYTAVWDSRPVGTTPGAGNYAYETLQLPAYTPVGTGYPPFRNLNVVSAPMYGTQGVPVQGIPTVAGQIVLQPLYNPYGG